MVQKFITALALLVYYANASQYPLIPKDGSAIVDQHDGSYRASHPAPVSYVSFVKHIAPPKPQQQMTTVTPPIPAPPLRSPPKPFSLPIRSQPDITSSMAHTPDRVPYVLYVQIVPQRQDYTKFNGNHQLNVQASQQPTSHQHTAALQGEPVFVQSKIPLSQKYYTLYRSVDTGVSPLLVAVQKPAYVRNMLYSTRSNPAVASKTLSYSPQLSYVRHVYQRA